MKTDIRNARHISSFVISCMHCHGTPYGFVLDPTIKSMWEKARTERGFIDAVLADETLAGEQFYAELSKRHSDECDHKERIMKMLKMCGADVFKTDADAGSVAIRSQDKGLTVHVPNGYGDCRTTVAIVDDNSMFNPHMMNSTGISVDGFYEVMECDCGETPVDLFDGRRFIYNYSGIVALVKY